MSEIIVCAVDSVNALWFDKLTTSGIPPFILSLSKDRPHATSERTAILVGTASPVLGFLT